MKRNGFTLVELLAVIVILSLIFMILLPSISSVLNESEEESDRIAEQEIINAAKEYVNDIDTNLLKSLVNSNDSVYIGISKLVSEGLIKKNDTDYKGVCAILQTNDKIKYILTEKNSTCVEGKSITVDLEMVQGTVYDDGTYIYHYKQSYGNTGWYNSDDDGWGVTLKDKTLTEVNVDPYSKINGKPIVSTENMFAGAVNLIKVKLDNFDTSSVINMSSMFSGCMALTSLDVNDFDTSNVKSMHSMFNGCIALTSLDVNNFNTSNVTTMAYMFCSCWALTSLDLSSFDTLKVTDMSSMFSGCIALTSLDVNDFDTSSVINMSSMFSGCSLLTSLDVNNFDTSKVTNMGGMFFACFALTSMDISNFDTSKVTDMSQMFLSCTALQTLNLTSQFNMNSVPDTTYMFYDDSNLVISVSNSTLYSKLNSLSTTDKPSTVTVKLVSS